MLQGDAGGVREHSIGVEPQVSAIAIPGFFHQTILLVGIGKEEHRVLIARVSLEGSSELALLGVVVRDFQVLSSAMRIVLLELGHTGVYVRVLGVAGRRAEVHLRVMAGTLIAARRRLRLRRLAASAARSFELRGTPR